MNLCSQEDVQLKDAVHLVFPYSGGSVFAGQFIGKHTDTPIVSQEKMSLTEAGTFDFDYITF